MCVCVSLACVGGSYSSFLLVNFVALFVFDLHALLRFRNSMRTFPPIFCIDFVFQSPPSHDHLHVPFMVISVPSRGIFGLTFIVIDDADLLDPVFSPMCANSAPSQDRVRGFEVMTNLFSYLLSNLSGSVCLSRVVLLSCFVSHTYESMAPKKVQMHMNECVRTP